VVDGVKQCANTTSADEEVFDIPDPA